VETALVRAVETLILPPGGPILLALAGLLAWRLRVGRWLVAAGILSLYLLSTPQFAALLVDGLQHAPILTPEETRAAGAQAVVVTLAGRYRPAHEYGTADTLSPMSIQRLRYGVWLSRRAGLPLAVTGGALEAGATPLAQLAARVLEEEYGMQPLAAEAQSETTWENAYFTARLLAPLGIRRVALVTSAFHLDRARYAFERAGFEVVGAPTGMYGEEDDSTALTDWLPSTGALGMSYLTLHEHLGGLWYRYREALERRR
jgi:uncharacterized SAM-binding protein YcdF (DUF218 family)